MDALKLLRPGMVLDLGFDHQSPWQRIESEVAEYVTPDGQRGEARITMSTPREPNIADTTVEDTVGPVTAAEQEAAKRWAAGDAQTRAPVTVIEADGREREVAPNEPINLAHSTLEERNAMAEDRQISRMLEAWARQTRNVNQEG